MKKHRSPFKNKIKNARESPSENSEKCSASTPYKDADGENTIITANPHLSAFTPKQLTDMPGTKSNKKKQIRKSARTTPTKREQTPTNQEV